MSRGRPAYAGLHVNRDNNNDVDEDYMMFYESKNDVGASSGAFDQFCCVIGQYLRFAVVCGVADVNKLSDTGMTFAAITHLTAVVAFLTYFDVRGTVSTVLTKALHLKKAFFYAKMYFRRSCQSDFLSEAERCDEQVSAIFNSRKRLSLIQASRRRAIEDRVALGNMLFPNDFLACISQSRSCMDGIMEWHDHTLWSHIKKGKSEKAARSLLLSHIETNKELVQKWCINFTAYIILVVGGQRPQVFAQLMCPEISDLKTFCRLSGQRGYCELLTDCEKLFKA